MLLGRDSFDAQVSTRVISILEPIGTAWINALRMTVIPLVVPLLIVGVAGSDDTRRAGILGARAFAWFFAMLVFFAVFTAIIAPWLYTFLTLDPVATERLRATAQIDLPSPESLSARSWLLGLIPLNPIRAAADGALLPVVLFTLLYSFALGRVAPEARESQIKFFRAMGDAMLVVVRWILAIAWLGIFALAVVLGEKLGTGVIGAIGFYVSVNIGLHIIGTVLIYLLVIVSRRVPITTFARSVIPAQVVGFGTRSSLASLPALVKGANDHLDLPESSTGFVLPLAVSVFKLTSAIYWIVAALFVARLYGLPLGFSSILLVGASSVVLSFSTPGIPSGGMLLQAPIYVAIGLPVEAIGILIALDTLPDMFKTLFNVTADMAVAILAPDRTDVNRRVGLPDPIMVVA